MHDGRADQEPLDALEAVDDRTFRFRLNQPYPKLLFALGKSSTPCAVHHAGTDRRDRSVQADQRVCRLRADALQEETNGCLAPGRCSRSSTAMCRATRRPSGCLAASASISTGSSGRSCPTVPPPRPRCRTARSTGWRRRCPTWSRCCGRTPALRSISPIRWATSAPSGSTTCIRRSTTCGRGARCRSRSVRKITWGRWSATTKRCGRRYRLFPP